MVESTVATPTLPLPKTDSGGTAIRANSDEPEDFTLVERSDLPSRPLSPHELQQRHDQFQISRLTVRLLLSV